MPSKETIAIGNELVNRWGHLNRQFGLYSGAVFRAILQKQEGREESQWVNVQSVLRFVKRYTGKEFGPTKLTNPELYVMESFVPNSDVERVVSEPLTKKTFRIGPVWPPKRFSTEIATAIPASREAMIQRITTDGHQRFERKFKEPYGGVSYFFDFQNSITQFQPSRSDLAALASENIHELFWRRLMHPEGFVVGSATVMRSSGMYVVMPNYHSRILEARIDGSRLRVEIDGSSGILVSDLRLVAKATGIPSGPSNGSAHIPFVQDPMTSPLIEQDFGMPLSSANVSLYWKPGQDEEPFVDDQLATKGPFSPQPMISVLEEFDPGLKILLGALTTTRAPHDMEWAVSTVMAMAGFAVEWLGYKGEKIQKLQSEIDLIARVPGELRVVLLECVTKEGDIGKKVADLNSKANDLLKIFPEWVVKKVVATTANTAASQPFDSDARNADIGILPKEALVDLLAAARSGVSAPIIFDLLASGVITPRFSE